MTRTILASGIAVLFLVGLGSQAIAGGTVTGKISAKPSKYEKDVVVYLEGAKVKVNAPDKPVIMDQKGMVFIPHVLAVVKGTTVAFQNSDKVRHNVFSPDHEKFNLGTWPTGENRKYTFKKLGTYTQLCNVHPEMEAYVVVLNTPYFAVSGKDGSFTIKDIPAGKYTVKVWSKKRKAAPQVVTVGGAGTTTVDIQLTK